MLLDFIKRRNIMKKTLSTILCIAVVSLLALTSCNTSETDVTSDAPINSSEASMSDSSETSDSTSAASSNFDSNKSTSDNTSSSDSGMTVDEYIEKEKASLDALSSSYTSLGLKTNIYAKGNSLVYSYQYTTDIGSNDFLKESLNSTLESLSSTYDSLLSMMKIQVPNAESIIVEYLDIDGNVIASKEYK